MNDTQAVDVLIIGGGAAGLTAAIYTARYNLKTLVVSTDFGGQILESADIDNWPGSPGISGLALSQAFENHAKSVGAQLVVGKITNIKKLPHGFEAASDGVAQPLLKAKTVILAAGAKHKKLGIRNEDNFLGKGISYCTTCDGAFFKHKVVAVVGGGDAAVTGALDLAQSASKVYIIHRREQFKAKPAYLELAKQAKNIEFILNANVIEAVGSNVLEGVILDNSTEVLPIAGLFVEIGFLPRSELASDLGLVFDKQGYVKVGQDQATSAAGVFAAGDLTAGSNRFAQLVTAASEGAIAAESAFRYIQSFELLAAS